METTKSALVKKLTEKKAFDDELKAEMGKALEEFGERFVPANAEAMAAK